MSLTQFLLTLKEFNDSPMFTYPFYFVEIVSTEPFWN